MPTIAQASVPVTSFPNLYLSPYGNDGVIPLYSSIPLQYQTSGDCLPCVLCGNSLVRQNVISQTGQQYATTQKTGVQLAVGT